MLREKEKISKSRLCRGLCSVQNLLLVEAAEGLSDMLLLTGLLERSGKSAEPLTYILTAEEYHRLALRDRIEEALRFGETIKAKVIFAEYRAENPPGKNKILQMYEERIQGILALEEYGQSGENTTKKEDATKEENMAEQEGTTKEENMLNQEDVAKERETQEEGENAEGHIEFVDKQEKLKTAAMHFMAAIDQTISYSGKFGHELIRELRAGKRLLAMFEIENILLYLHVQWMLKWGRTDRTVGDIVSVSGENMQDDELRAQGFAKVGMLLGERYLEKKDYRACVKLHEEILELNRKCCTIVCVLPVAEQIVTAYTKLGEVEKAEFYRVHKENLRGIFEEFQISSDCVNKLYYTYHSRQYFLEGEIIAAERKWKGMSQDELVEGIYQNTENLSRVETGKANADRKKFYQLMERLGIDKTRYNGNLITDEYELLLLEQSIEKHLARRHYEEVGHELYMLEKYVNMGEKCNQQIVLGMKNMEMYRSGKIGIEEAITKAKELLELTYHLDNMEKDGKRYRRIPFQNEMYLFNQICILLRIDGKIKEVIAMMERMMRTYDAVKEDSKFHFSNVHLCATNLCQYLEMVNRLDEAESVVDRMIRDNLVNGNIAFMHRLFATKFDIAEKRSPILKYGRDSLWKAYYLSEWCSDYKKDYERLRETVKI